MARGREEKTLRFDISELPIKHSIFMAERGSLTVLARCILGWIGCFSDEAAVVYRESDCLSMGSSLSPCLYVLNSILFIFNRHGWEH